MGIDIFIIFGSPRSGTTLLSTLLSANNYIHIPDETDFIVPLAFILNRIEDEAIGKSLISRMIVSSKRFSCSLGQSLSVNEVINIVWKSDYKLDSILSNLFNASAKNNGAMIGGDKSPNDLLNIRVLEETGLGSESIKIIHIVRDIRDVILSLKNVDWDVDWKDNIETFFPRMWCDSNLYLNQLYSKSEQKYTLIKYEDLLHEPHHILHQLTDFLGVPFDENMLEKSTRAQKYLNVSHHENVSKDIMKTRAYAWKENITQDMLDVIDKQASEAINFFGYRN
ncbi:sulfotransferase family protein [Paenibacillus silvae]|uniref:sulfotransferase family protein n=1 Tax=Paenibacillus silvae TaxID=1325358 RepID=UPI00166F11FB|nr:sulfotransferase [Paenibacillus silvae]